MATSTTTNLGLVKPDYSEEADIAVINQNMDKVDAASGNAYSDIGIVEKTNTATHNITKGQYVIWKGALYTANANISSGATLNSSKLTAVSNGGLNHLSEQMSEQISNIESHALLRIGGMGTGESDAEQQFVLPRQTDRYIIFVYRTTAQSQVTQGIYFAVCYYSTNSKHFALRPILAAEGGIVFTGEYNAEENQFILKISGISYANAHIYKLA